MMPDLSMLWMGKAYRSSEKGSIYSARQGGSLHRSSDCKLGLSVKDFVGGNERHHRQKAQPAKVRVLARLRQTLGRLTWLLDEANETKSGESSRALVITL